MSYTEVSSDFHDQLFTLRPISLQGSTSELWTRTPQGKSMILRMHSMLPQFKITSEVLNQLWTISTKTSTVGSGVCTAYKYSPSHFLSLKATEVHYLTRGQVIPPADYLLYLFEHPASSSAEQLKSDSKVFEKMMKSIERHITKTQSLEPLDICRTLLIFSADKINKSLQIRCEILYPSVSLKFTPILSLKLVSTPLSVKLTQNTREKFQSGYLTMDQSGRVLPLLPTDPLAYKYPIVGIWVTGVPETQNTCAVMHPLVWSNCVQFIENSNIKDKISPNLEENVFLFLHFSSKPKYYEVCTVENSCWRTSKYCTEVAREHRSFAPCYATFVKEEQSSSSLEISINLPRTMNTSFIPANRAHGAKPPRISVSPGHNSNRSSDSFRNLYSPSAERVISEQNRMLAHLQAQISELQAQILHNTPRNQKSKSIAMFTPTRGYAGDEDQQLVVESTYKEAFNETPKVKRSASRVEDVIKSRIKRLPDIRNENSGKKSLNGSVESIGKPNVLKNIKNIEDRVYNPLRYSNASPEPLPQPSQTTIKGPIQADHCKNKPQTESENTICVPKIEYDSGSDSSGEDEQIEAVERKYLYQN